MILVCLAVKDSVSLSLMVSAGRTKGPKVHNAGTSSQASLLTSQIDHVSQHLNSNQSWYAV
jgi:ribosomal protein S15P/S13E